MAKFGKNTRTQLNQLKLVKHMIQQKLLKQLKTATAKFDESVDVAVRLGVNPKYADQQVRGAVVLPHGTGKSKRVLVLLKAIKLLKQKLLELTLLVLMNSLQKSKRAGVTSMLQQQLLI